MRPGILALILKIDKRVYQIIRDNNTIGTSPASLAGGLMCLSEGLKQIIFLL